MFQATLIVVAMCMRSQNDSADEQERFGGLWCGSETWRGKKCLVAIVDEGGVTMKDVCTIFVLAINLTPCFL